MKYRRSVSPALRPKTLPHLGPLLGLVGDQLTEVGGLAGSAVPPKSARAWALILGLGEGPGSISWLSLADDFGGRVPRCADAEPCASLIARQELGDGRQSSASHPSASLSCQRHDCDAPFLNGVRRGLSESGGYAERRATFESGGTTMIRAVGGLGWAAEGRRVPVTGSRTPKRGPPRTRLNLCSGTERSISLP